MLPVKKSTFPCMLQVKLKYSFCYMQLQEIDLVARTYLAFLDMWEI